MELTLQGAVKVVGLETVASLSTIRPTKEREEWTAQVQCIVAGEYATLKAHYRLTEAEEAYMRRVGPQAVEWKASGYTLS